MPYLIGVLFVALVFVIVGVFKFFRDELKFFDIFQMSLLYVLVCMGVAAVQTALGPIVYEKKVELVSSQPLISFDLDGNQVLVAKQDYILSEEIRGSWYTFYTKDEDG